ncbi:prephenate dehydrogenase [Planctomycetes bacterium Pan216]|uniref:Prephenate dehydrogenase n=1 Tax=Kolteria novifilia TaxID=2527975 RepID=A0A518B5P9_9BACT|nr:prephenate dehydrogenase [Planctomycetes bacterium Pan216]
MFDSVGIVGVGLLGASLGLSLKQRALCERVIGFGRRKESLDIAQSMGAIDEAHLEWKDVLGSVDLLVVCVPVDKIASTVVAATPLLPPGAVVTDVGSTKSALLARIEKELGAETRFVGSHPLAGSEKSGPGAAQADLFDERVCVMTPTDRTPDDVLATVRTLWEAVGMRLHAMSPQRHDEILARTSHLPHVAAAALMGVVEDGDLPFAAGGLRDTTRIAASAPELWRAILMENADAVDSVLADYVGRLNEFRVALSRGDAATLERLYRDGKRRRDTLGH